MARATPLTLAKYVELLRLWLRRPSKRAIRDAGFNYARAVRIVDEGEGQFPPLKVAAEKVREALKTGIYDTEDDAINAILKMFTLPVALEQVDDVRTDSVVETAIEEGRITEELKKDLAQGAPVEEVVQARLNLLSEAIERVTRTEPLPSTPDAPGSVSRPNEGNSDVTTTDDSQGEGQPSFMTEPEEDPEVALRRAELQRLKRKHGFTEPDLVLEEHLIMSLALVKQYRAKIATWLAGGKVDPKTGNVDPGIAVKPSELRQVIEMGFDLVERARDMGASNPAIEAFRAMSKEELYRFVVGEYKPMISPNALKGEDEK